MKTITSDTATPAKLKNGSWGARLELAGGTTPEAGDTITVEAKSGKSWTATVDRVLWTGSSNGRRVYLLAVQGHDAPRPQRRSYGRSKCDTCRCHAEVARSGFSADLHDGCDYCGCESA